MTTIALRPAQPADIPAIAAIYADAVRTGTASFEIEPPELTEMARRYRALADAGFPYLVADIDGVVAAYAYAGPYRPRPAYRFTVEDSIYVAAEHRRRGLGAMLLTDLIGACEQRGFRQMIAVIGDSDQPGSIALHRAAGFEMVGTLHAVGCKFGRWLDSVLMQRPLAPGGRV